MADIRPFRACRPAAGLESEIAALPYDVYSRSEAREYVASHPGSFLAIDRAETTMPADMDIYDRRVYEHAHDLLSDWIRKGRFVQDSTPCYYVYAQTMDGRTQTGIVACSSIDDYDSGVIKKHENTRADKEKDRICHVDACSAQTGPIFLCYRQNQSIDGVVCKTTSDAPACEQFVCFTVFCDRFRDDFIGKMTVIAGIGFQPVPDILLVIGGLGLSHYILRCRPEP